jgi:hypothetical protein
MRVVGIAVFAIAAVSTLLLSTGVAAPPHRVAAGTPLNHTLVLGAYRFAFLIEPVAETSQMSPEMAALHRILALAGIPMTDMPGMSSAPDTSLGPIFATSGLHPAQDLAVALALLVIAWPRLPRPTRFVIGEVFAPAVRATQWRTPSLLAPPRP